MAETPDEQSENAAQRWRGPYPPTSTSSARNQTASPGPARPKRAQVAAACINCRAKKIKCDAGRPCRSCDKKGLTCVYETQAGETHREASKRKYIDVAQAHDAYAELFHMLRDPDERRVADVVHHVRRGLSPATILEIMKTDAPSNPGSGEFDSRASALQALLITLAHSTGSGGEIVALAALTLNPSLRIQLPGPQWYLSFRNRIVYVPNVRRLLEERAVSSQIGLLEDDNPRNDHILDDQYHADDPPHRLTAAPWTSVTDSDEAVSHLVSLFLAWINPTWRFVEQDLFLKGMQSNDLESELCSPFLVNSICAVASLHSEHQVAFVEPECDRITRGRHFHDEALRLWALEESRPMLTNIQALCVLSLEANYRAIDRLGLTLIPQAVELDNQLPLEGDDGFSSRDFTRARLSAHWAAKCTHIIMLIAFMSPRSTVSRVTGLPKIQEVFTDTFEHWSGYPMTSAIVFYRPTLYLQERCRLAELFHHMHEVILGDKWPYNVRMRDYAGAVDQVAEQMQLWFQRLPYELHYHWPVTVNVWELHASYLSALMILWTAAKARLEQEDSSAASHGDPRQADFCTRRAREYLAKAIPLAHRAAQLLREFRENYGLKITPAWLLQLQGVTAGVLMQDPELIEPTFISSPRAQGVSRTIDNSHSAFDEVFRTLLGTGVEVMIARGVARMMYHTALERRIPLTQSTGSLLQILSSTAWKPGDLRLLNSNFPNYASSHGYGDSARLTVLLSKWEKLEI